MSKGYLRRNRQHKQPKIRREADVVILPVTGGVDVFTGKGWESWTRFNTTKGYPEKVAGQSLTDKDYNQVFSVVTGG